MKTDRKSYIVQLFSIVLWLNRNHDNAGLIIHVQKQRSDYDTTSDTCTCNIYFMFMDYSR